MIEKNYIKGFYNDEYEEHQQMVTKNRINFIPIDEKVHYKLYKEANWVLKKEIEAVIEELITEKNFLYYFKQTNATSEELPPVTTQIEFLNKQILDLKETIKEIEQKISILR